MVIRRSAACPLFSSTITILRCASQVTAPFVDLLYQFSEEIELMEAARLTLVVFMWIIPPLRASARDQHSAALCDSCVDIMRNLMVHLVDNISFNPRLYENIQGLVRLLSVFLVYVWFYSRCAFMLICIFALGLRYHCIFRLPLKRLSRDTKTLAHMH